ncbi:MAG: extracellular solute-binding protein [Planctomycetota bacterium]|jgi:iron(III) transport system substrate-binding protein
MRRWLIGCAVLLGLLAGCPRGSGPSVVVYASADEYIARQVIAAFEEATGIRVRFVGDTEAKKTTGLIERLRAEANNPQADVFWSSEIFMTIGLADDGLLEPFESEATSDWPAPWRDPQRRWHGFAARARVIVYAPKRVTAEERPETWMDLTDSYWKGRLVMADPRFGTTGGHLGAIKAYWDREFQPGIYTAFLMGLADNDVRLLPSGNAGVVAAVVSGEADVGLTDTDDVWAAQAQGRDVQLIYPAHSNEPGATGIGTLLIPNTVGLVKGGPNPQSAERFIEFLLSERVERMLAESVSHNVPLRPGLAADYPDVAVPDPLRIDYRLAAGQRDEAVALAMRYLTDR